MAKYTWSRTEGYECSSIGDRRYSAFYAYLSNGNTIEYEYQCRVKGYPSIRAGKGKPPLKPYSKEELWTLYLSLWQDWAWYNPDLVDELILLCKKHNNVLRDSFAKTPINQAHALSVILSNWFNSAV